MLILHSFVCTKVTNSSFVMISKKVHFLKIVNKIFEDIVTQFANFVGSTVTEKKSPLVHLWRECVNFQKLYSISSN